MKKLFIVLGVLLGVGLVMPREAMAQAQQDSLTLDLDKILEIALSDNPDIQVADRTIEIQKYAKKETITGLFPKVDLSAQGVKNLKVATMVMNMGGQTITVHMGQPYNYSATAQAALPLFAPQLWKSVTLSEEQVKLAVEQARESKINTIASVKNAYYSLLLARESCEALMAGYKTAERNVEDTKKSFEQGLVSEYDKLTADVQLAGIKPNLLAAQNGIKLAEMQLKVLMGVDVNEPLRFTGRLEDFEEGLFADLMNLKADTDLSDNSAIRQLDYNARILRLSEKINKLGYLPTLAIAISGGYTAMPQEFNPFKATYFGSDLLSCSVLIDLFDVREHRIETVVDVVDAVERGCQPEQHRDSCRAGGEQQGERLCRRARLHDFGEALRGGFGHSAGTQQQRVEPAAGTSAVCAVDLRLPEQQGYAGEDAGQGGHGLEENLRIIIG